MADIILDEINTEQTDYFKITQLIKEINILITDKKKYKRDSFYIFLKKHIAQIQQVILRNEIHNNIFDIIYFSKSEQITLFPKTEITTQLYESIIKYLNDQEIEKKNNKKCNEKSNKK